DVGREDFGGQLVESVRGCIARPANEDRPAVDAKAPPALADVPGQLAKSKPVLDPRRLDAVGGARDQLRVVDRLAPEAPGLPTFRAGQRKADGHRVLRAPGQVDLAPDAQGLASRHGHDQLDLAVHVSSVQVAKSRLDREPAVSTLAGRPDAHPVDGDRPYVL